MAKVKGPKKSEIGRSLMMVEIDPTECPFREFRDHELGVEYWGQSPAQFRATSLYKVTTKPPADYVWMDDQTQPLPRSVRKYLHGWVRAEELAASRWEADVVIYHENGHGKMSVADIQLSHAQVLLRSAFCRRVLSACYILERVEGLPMEHQWENFSFTFGLEGWRAKYHIYSPGMKSGGGTQHRPTISRNGCYLVRLYHLGMWRCVWVSDQVPVDATDAPLLPFSPLMSRTPSKLPKQPPALVTASHVYLWPLLICKALLKIAAPDMNSDEEIQFELDSQHVEDEKMSNFNMLHALTGCMSHCYYMSDPEEVWHLLQTEVPVFTWDDDDETIASTIKSKSTKKPSNKENSITKRAIVSVFIAETKNEPPYTLPGITPAHPMSLYVSMIRDLPLKKPLPEPEVALWKHYRWVDWARRHGLYEAYDCPRTRYLKVNGLMKLSYAPHLLDVASTESLTHGFREEQEKDKAKKDKGKDGKDKSAIQIHTIQHMKEELREWVQYKGMAPFIRYVNVLFFPSMFQHASAGSCPPIRTPGKTAPNKALDIQAPKSAPLYLQIDGPEDNNLKMSLNMLHPRILINSGVHMDDVIEPAYLILEEFEWFKDTEVPKAKAYVETLGYESVEIDFLPGRHFCRLWVHSRMHWHVTLLSESAVLLGTRDVILMAAVRECHWAARFLSYLGSSFNNWIRINRSSTNIILHDREFYSSYQPDLEWNPEVVGYNKEQLHWMFRAALQSLLARKLQHHEYQIVCAVLRHYLCDPDFGFPPKPKPTKTLREIVAIDPCDCVMPEVEEIEGFEEHVLEEHKGTTEDLKPIVSATTMEQLLSPPKAPTTSQACELASEDLPCGVLKEEREKVFRKHEAATFLQAHWRGTFARMCLKKHMVASQEVLKLLSETAFGNLDALQSLMNEFFTMYPGVKYAYSISSGLSGVYGLNQHYGTSPATPKCKWIPYFQGVFFCHQPVKVHFDIQSSIQYNTLAVYNNDSGLQMPQAYNAHITFHFQPNNFGYTVMGHGTITKSVHTHSDIHWSLTVMTSIDNVFHVCDCPENDLCTTMPLPPATKLHIEEMYIPNKRNILGGITISVTKIEAVSFRATTTAPDLDLLAILRTMNPDGIMEEIGRCTGKGEIVWPYLRLKGIGNASGTPMLKKKSVSHAVITMSAKESSVNTSARGKRKAISAGMKSRSSTKLKETKPPPIETKNYVIEVIAPNGWALPLEQWKRVDEIRNALEPIKVEIPPKKPPAKTGSAKDKKEKEPEKEKEKPVIFTVHPPLPEDAFTVLECSTAIGGGAFTKRDDERDIYFATVRRSWDTKEPGRNLRGAKIRNDFREEFLVPLPSPVTKTTSGSSFEEGLFEGEMEETKAKPAPTPASESGLMETMVEEEEETTYFTFPDLLRDKFIPLYFVPLCTKEKFDSGWALMTPDIAEAAKKELHTHIEVAIERMRDLQKFNETFVLARQKRRSLLLEQLCVDSHWTPDLHQVLEERDEAIAREAFERNAETNKKKQEAKQATKK